MDFLTGFDSTGDSPWFQCVLFSAFLFWLAACHSSCLSCVGPEPSHCVQCKEPEEGLQVEQVSGANIASGKCLSQCRAQFYLENTGLCEGE